MQPVELHSKPIKRPLNQPQKLNNVLHHINIINHDNAHAHQKPQVEGLVCMDWLLTSNSDSVINVTSTTHLG
jgi:hypothetical protein